MRTTGTRKKIPSQSTGGASRPAVTRPGRARRARLPGGWVVEVEDIDVVLRHLREVDGRVRVPVRVVVDDPLRRFLRAPGIDECVRVPEVVGVLDEHEAAVPAEA